ncbi:tight junction-associated protein 1 isoform 2-T2 [Synchiropus picturatus]
MCHRTLRLAPLPARCLKQQMPLDGDGPSEGIRKSKSMDLLEERLGRASPRCSAPPSPAPLSHHRGDCNWKVQILEEKLRFSQFLDELIGQVLSPAHLILLGHEEPDRLRCPGLLKDCDAVERRRRWDRWVAALEQQRRRRRGVTDGTGLGQQLGRARDCSTQECSVSNPSKVQEADVSDPDRIRILQQQNQDLRRRLSLSTQKMEAMEAEFDSNRHYMEAELGRTRDDLEKMRDKFRRLQNSYTASQRANQELEEKLHALLRTVERDKRTMDQEMVELTNKLLDAKNVVNHLEELNERYRQDCNLAVQLLKCNKSHFRNHKFSDLPWELQDMLHKHMNALPVSGCSPSGQDPDSLSLTPADVVPTSVIARVLEKPEPLLLNSAQSSSCGRPVAEDVFVHVDMSGPAGGSHEQLNGSCRSLEREEPDSEPAFDKLHPYPPPAPPLAHYQGRRVIEFSSDDKVKIPKNSPLPNCTYATRQAISLSLVQSEEERPAPGKPRPPPDAAAEPPSSQSSPFSSPPQAPSVLASSASSEEDLLASWQRMFVEKKPPSAGDVQCRQAAQAAAPAAAADHQRAAYSDGEEGSSAQSWTPSRGSSLDTDTDTETRPSCSGSEHLLMVLEDDSGSVDTAVTVATAPTDAHWGEEEEEGEERDVLPHDLPVIPPRLLDLDPALASAPPRPQKSPKRMGVHHLHRKDSLTRAQEQGTLLD